MRITESCGLDWMPARIAIEERIGMGGLTKYLFAGILGFVLLVGALRAIDSVPFWGWLLIVAGIAAGYVIYRRKRG